MDWYDENIEEGISKAVKLLRDNGFNTECSCDHEMYIQCQYLPDGAIHQLHNILFNNGYENYTITVIMDVIDGHSYSFLDVKFTEDK